MTNAAKLKSSLQQQIEAIYDETGQKIAVEGVVRDITPRRQIAKELEQRVAQLAIINEISSQIATLMDLDGVLKRTARLVQETFEYHHVALFLLDGDEARLKAVAGSYERHFPADHHQSLRVGIVGWVGAHGQRVVANDVSTEPRYISLISDGTETQAELCLPIKLGDQTVGVLDVQSCHLNAFTINDVIAMETLCAQIAVAIENARLYETIQQELVEHRQTADSLQTAHRQNEQLLASISSILISVDAHNRITHWNTPAEAAFGFTATSVLGRPLLTSGIAWEWSDILKSIAVARAEGRPAYQSNIHYTRADGQKGFLNLTVAPFIEQDSDHSGFLLVAEEITERKIMESQLVQSQKLEAIGHLAAGIAHEINTPTQYIGDNVNFLQESFYKIRQVIEKYQHFLQTAKGETSLAEGVAEVESAVEKAHLSYLLEEIPQAIEETLSGIKRVTKIVQAMKEFSHPGVQNKTATNLNQAIESTITVARNEWKYVAEVVTNLDPNLPPVPCLAGEFNQVILNILVNAAHAIAEVVAHGSTGKGTITITTRRDGDWAEIRISDTGVGIPESARARVFEPFFTTKEVGKGTGQGLTIAHALIVKELGGTITFETEVSRGTTFIIRLPIEFAAEIETNVAQ